MSALTLEERVAALEAKVEQLQRQEASKSDETKPWWGKIVGIHADNPDFEEAVRLGREWRESFRPDDYEDGETEVSSCQH